MNGKKQKDVLPHCKEKQICIKNWSLTLRHFSPITLTCLGSFTHLEVKDTR